MLKKFIRIIYLPVDSVMYAIRHKRGQRKMMAYSLKISQCN